MIFRSKTESQLLLEGELVHALKTLRSHKTGSEEYVKTLDALVTMYEMKNSNRSSSVSKDTIANVVANLIGIVLILKHENLNPITSKALQFVFRLK